MVDQAPVPVVDRVEKVLRGHVQRLVDRGDVGTAMLPREEDLASEVGVSRKSVRQAKKRLEREDLIRSVRGKGTFVRTAHREVRDVLLLGTNPHHHFEVMAIAVASNLLSEHSATGSFVSSCQPAEEWGEILRRRPSMTGVMLVGPYTRWQVQELRRRTDLPIVQVTECFEEYRQAPTVDTVLTDNRLLGYMATEHLLRQGHRRIAILGWGPRCIWSRDWQQGYEEALLANGITPDPSWAVYLVPEEELAGKEASAAEVQRQIDSWDASPNAPTAMVHTAASESFVSDILHKHFHNRLSGDAVLPAVSIELLHMFYKGIRPAYAMATPLGDVIRRGLELLWDPARRDQPPVQEMRSQVFLCRREGGVWRKTPPE